MRPNELADELGMSAKTLRAWLRLTFPRSAEEHNTEWHLIGEQVAAARTHFGHRGLASGTAELSRTSITPSRGRSLSDEAYVTDLCDDILDEKASRQHRFPWLLGDPGGSGRRATLPVDAYYPEHQLVVEYREIQHSQPVKFFDRRETISGVGRGEQRRIYDRRRETEIPRHGLRLIIVDCTDLDSDPRGRLRRNRSADGRALETILRGVAPSR